MKKVLLLLLLISGFGLFVNAQTQDNGYLEDVNLTARDSLMFQYLDGYRVQLRKPAFQLFETKNIWTFLKLNTVTGQIWQVQYSVEGSLYRFETELNSTILISETYDDVVCGRFTLYATDNMYNFLLLDQIDGRCWQVQWSTKSSERGIWRIY